MASIKEWLDERPGVKLAEGETARRSGGVPTIFNPLTQVSADAKYIVRWLAFLFLVLPVMLGLIIYTITR